RGRAEDREAPERAQRARGKRAQEQRPRANRGGTDRRHQRLFALVETYDREMADVFAIQSDIAQGVAYNSRVTLLPGEKARVERKPTDNLEAYNLYLQGVYYATLTGGSATGGGAMKAIDSFSAAIAKDPNFAWA